MTLTTPFDSRHAMAIQVQKHARPEFDKLNLLPWNRFEDDSGLWWLVPSSRSPAFSDTKFYVGEDRAGQGRIEVGLHAEKGFGNRFAQFEPSARSRGWIMDQMWHWGKFLEMITSSRVLTAMQTATRATGAPIYLRVTTYPHTDRSEVEQEGPQSQSDNVVYRLDPNTTRLVLDDEPTTTQGILKRWQAEDADRLPDLLLDLTANDWVWVDLMIYTPFTPAALEVATWDAHRIWREYLSLFSFAVASLYI